MTQRIFKTFSVIALALLLVTACSKKEDKKAAPASKPAIQQTSPQVQSIEQQKQRIRDASSTGRIKVEQVTTPAPAAQSTSAIALPRPVEGPVRTQTVFVCNDGTYFLAQFKPNTVDITYEKQQPFSMQQELMASGFRYFNRYYEMRGKGRYITWKVGKRPAVICEAQ